MSSPEIIDIGVEKIDIATDLGPPPTSGPPKSVNFGPGIEMLMNDRKKGGNSDSLKGDIDLDDLNKLEDELNDLGDVPKVNKSEASSSIFSNPFGGNMSKGDDGNFDSGIKLNIEEPKLNLSGSGNVGVKKEETWDGYKKFNEIPVNPTANVVKSDSVPMSREEKMRQKFEYLRKLDKLEMRGVKLSKKYNMESSLDEMRAEYDMIISEKEKSNSVKFQGKIMMACVTALEYLNGKFDPFDLKLDGWAESVNENIDDYDEIFSELHEKYKSKAKMAPELKLLFQLGGSAVMLHMTNTMFKSAMPGMDDIMRQNPELMQQFTQAAVNSMGEQNPGFGNFMNGIMSGNAGSGMQQSQPTMSPMGAPPGPVRPPTRSERPEMIPPGPRTNRTDVGMNRGVPDFNDAVDVGQGFGSYGGNDSGSSKRPDMKGPSDISDLLSGLKSKQNNRPSGPTREITINKFNGENGSTISIDELKSISKDADNVPRKTKRKPRSERNTVSLDI
jgi:hypothetical protein